MIQIPGANPGFLEAGVQMHQEDVRFQHFI